MREWWSDCPRPNGSAFRFLHVSTDEVYGSLGPDDPPFSETTPFAPNSPYAASKASSDHLVRAYHHTYGLPTLTTNCSNNYGPLQFPEKLIPLMIVNAVGGQPLPVYGDGRNVRDWSYVGDHCERIRASARARPARRDIQRRRWQRTANIDVVSTICDLLDDLRAGGAPHARLITFVTDRPGHDWRYSLSSHKVRCELGWRRVMCSKWTAPHRPMVHSHMDWVQRS